MSIDGALFAQYHHRDHSWVEARYYRTLQEAADAVPLGGTLHVATGVYSESNATQLLKVARRMRILGDGYDSVLRQTGSGHCLVVDGPADPAGDLNGICIENLTLATESGGGDALRLDNVHRSVFRHVNVPSAAAKGVHLRGALLDTFLGVIVSTNLPYPFGTRAVPTHGFNLDALNAIDSNDNGFVACVTEGILTSPGTGVNMVTATNGGGNAFLGGSSEGNTIGVALGASKWNTFIGFNVESNGTNITGSLASHNWIGSPAAAGALSLVTAAGTAGCTLHSGSGAPTAGLGENGDIYFRSDGGLLTVIYQKRAGTWEPTAA